MKKLKSILCMAFMFVIGLSVLVGCNNTPPADDDTPDTTPTEVTVTLNEAKSMIVNSLEDTGNTQLNSSRLSTSTVGNRNIFVRLGNSEFIANGDFDYGNTISGLVNRTTTSWTKYSMQTGNDQYGTLYGYYDGENAYSKNNYTYTKESFEDSYFGLILQSVDCVYVDLLFIEDAWVSIYGDTATKSTKDYGFALTMNVNMPSYVDFVMAKCSELGLGTEGLFGEGDYLQKNKDEGSVSLTVRFDSSLNIIGLDMIVSSLYEYHDNENYSFFDTTFIINKYNHEIVAPDWFNESDYE